MIKKASFRIDSAIDYSKDKRFLRFMRRVLKSIGFKYFHRTLIFYFRDLNQIPDEFEGSEYGLSVATVEDVENEPDYDDRWHGRAQAIERIKNGHILYIHRQEGKIVYFTWLYLNKVDIYWLDLHFQIPKYMTYSTGLYTLPEYQRRGIAYIMGTEKVHHMKNAGIRYDFSVREIRNTASIQLGKKRGASGSKEYQIVHYYRFWFIKYYRVESFNSGEHESFIRIFKAPEGLWKIYLPIELKN